MRLRLDSIDLYHIQVPFREPIQIGSAVIQVKDAVIVRLQTSRATGWGEASISLDPDDQGPSSEACWSEILERLGPAVLSWGDVDVEAVSDKLAEETTHPCAAAGVEMAIWHAAAMARDIPLHSLLGGVAQPIASGLCSGPCASVEELLERIERHLAGGYRRVKIRIRPEWDLEPIASVRQRWPDVPIVVDAGGSYGLDDLQTLRNLDKYRLAAIEQPLRSDAVEDLAQLQAVLAAPICIDACGLADSRIEEIGRRKAARILRISVQRIGGLTPALRVHELARKAGLTCSLSSTPDLGIAAAGALHLATLDAFVHPIDVCSANRWFKDDLLEPPIVVDAGGYLHLPDGPGFGYRPSPEKVEKYAIRQETLTS
ncbi:MAG: hypothetical protein JXQ73_07355 [Phycisphaerae bacterium]|nr:hypothetical protein [Phycisphaerae bacterium]